MTEMTPEPPNYHRECLNDGSYSLFQFERSNVIFVLESSAQYSFVFFKCLMDKKQSFAVYKVCLNSRISMNYLLVESSFRENTKI